MKKQIVTILIIALLTSTILIMMASAAGGSQTAFLPAIYNGDPPLIPGSWVYIGLAKESQNITEIYGEKPSVCYEMSANKNDKTITVSTHYIGDAKCSAWVDWANEHGNIPHEILFPLPACTGNDNIDSTFFPCECSTYELARGGYFCGAVYSLDFPASSKWVCGNLYPWNCVETR